MADNRDRAALAAMIYGEARNQGFSGKAAVGWTALTRAQLAGVPVSDVVYGSASPKYGQYSFANPQDPNAAAVANAPYDDPDGWQDALDMADGVLSGEIENPVPGATNYQVTGTGAAWATPDTEIGTLGAHSFYQLPQAEVASVVRASAASPYRRQDLVDPEMVDTAPAGGLYQGLDRIDGEPRTISTGEFGFSSRGAERGFGEMNQDTQQVASEIARTLPADQDMTITATHGQHGLGNLTHTPGAAFDVRTRGLSSDQLDDMVDSTLYSRPAAVGYNSGAGKFPAHMHVDTNAGYGTGLQSTSDLTGLSDYAKEQLARYDADMKSGLGYAPPVPESIAPVPEASPLTAMAAAQPAPQTVAQAEPAALSGGLSAYVEPGAQTTTDGVPVQSVQTTTYAPPAAAPADPAPAALASYTAPPGNTYAREAGLPSTEEAMQVEPTYTPEDIANLQQDVADYKAAQAPVAPAPEPETDIVDPAPAAPVAAAPVRALAYAEPAPRTVAAASAPRPALSQDTGMDVWQGNATRGVASDGSTLTRNPDGSVSRFSQKSGLTETISGPGAGAASYKNGNKGFWGSMVDSVGDMFGGDIGTMGERSKRVGGALANFPSAPAPPTQAEVDAGQAAMAANQAQNQGAENRGGGWGFGGLGGALTGGLLGGLLGGPAGLATGAVAGYSLGSSNSSGWGSGDNSQADKASRTPGLY